MWLIHDVTSLFFFPQCNIESVRHICTTWLALTKLEFYYCNIINIYRSKLGNLHVNTIFECYYSKIFIKIHIYIHWSSQFSLYFTSNYWIKMFCKQHFTFICFVILKSRLQEGGKKSLKVHMTNFQCFNSTCSKCQDWYVCKTCTAININQWNNLQDMGPIIAHCFHTVCFCEWTHNSSISLQLSMSGHMLSSP